MTAFPGNLQTSYSHHFSLDTEYQLPYNLVASVGYEGSASRHLIRHSEADATAAVAHGIALNPLVTDIEYFSNSGTSNNNALLLDLKHTMSHHFSVDAQFTYAKSMDDNSGPLLGRPLLSTQPQLRLRSLDFNVGKLFKMYGLWQPVFFHGSNAFLEKIAGQWSVSGIWNVHTGYPVHAAVLHAEPLLRQLRLRFSASEVPGWRA